MRNIGGVHGGHESRAEQMHLEYEEHPHSYGLGNVYGAL